MRCWQWRRNNHGYAVLVHLVHMGCANLFEQGKLGWLTSAATRPAMIENMAAVLVESGVISQSEIAARVPDVCEACGWERCGSRRGA